MSFFIQSLFIVIPIFIILIVLEIIVAKKMKIKINNPVDIISSLSSGITNIAKDGLKFGVLIISYSWLVKHITILKIEPIWLAIIIAFIVQDFSGYWLHRMNHRINIFWNRHIIHHSSEEFNLSCALRQEISTIVRFGAIFMLPAALLGISPTIFAVLGPIHLFMQFWYHTRLINKMGLLETIFVTPSHHRVHHAINTKYMDKNYGQILIIWDKFFGTFQPELKEEKPVYGIIRPANTWNPIIINYKHFWQLLKDAYYTKTWKDKLRIWFMPTGWRPKDVEDLFPIKSIRDSKSQIKYQTNNSRKLILWSFFQLFISGSLMLLMFSIASKISNITLFCLAFFLILNVFSYT
ncbi:MAG: sterol desaturase family protein, partial [Candidatus Marinimicrobia bacterium]|nr:sterol desaturase family protein [Candidatus Neomarinimicrobiota bacterium]